jgi:hypothetical protein
MICEGRSMERGYVVDWQIQDSVAPVASLNPIETREVYRRLKVLEAQAMQLLSQLRTERRRESMRRSLASFEAEIAGLRADLAWRRMETRYEARNDLSAAAINDPIACVQTPPTAPV